MSTPTSLILIIRVRVKVICSLTFSLFSSTLYLIQSLLVDEEKMSACDFLNLGLKIMNKNSSSSSGRNLIVFRAPYGTSPEVVSHLLGRIRSNRILVQRGVMYKHVLWAFLFPVFALIVLERGGRQRLSSRFLPAFAPHFPIAPSSNYNYQFSLFMHLVQSLYCLEIILTYYVWVFLPFFFSLFYPAFLSPFPISDNQDCMEILPTNSSLLNFVEFYRKEAVTSGRLLHVILIIFKSIVYLLSKGFWDVFSIARKQL